MSARNNNPCPCGNPDCDAKSRAKTMVSRKCKTYRTEAEAVAAGKTMEAERKSGTRTSGTSGAMGKPGASGGKARTDADIKASVAGFEKPCARVKIVIGIVDSALGDVTACIYPKPGETAAAIQTRMDICLVLDYVRKRLKALHWDVEYHRMKTDSPLRRESMDPRHPRYIFGDTLLRKTWDSSACECAFDPRAEPTELFRDVVTEAEDESVRASEVPKTSVLSKTVVRASLDKVFEKHSVIFVQSGNPEVPILEFLGYDERVRIIDLQTCTAHALQHGKSVAGSDCPIATNAAEMTFLLLNETFQHRARSDAFHQARIASLFWPKFYELLKSKLGDDLDEILDNYDVEGYEFPTRPAAADGVAPCAKKRKAAA